MLKLARSTSWLGLYALLLALAIAASGELGFSRSVTPGLVSRYAGLFGSDVRGQLEGWKGFVRGLGGGTGAVRGGTREVDLLGPVNRFFNGMALGSDLKLWGVEDYWTTPAEFVSIHAGDCEDYAIAKYFALKELGIPVTRLRLIYAKTWSSSRSAHMVLAYYPNPGADPLILDNHSGSINQASDRPDLTPVYAFNDDDTAMTNTGIQISGRSVRQWQNVLEKLERELKY